MNNRELTIAEYAKLNNVSVQSVYDRINRGTLKTTESVNKKGRKIKYIVLDTTEEEDNKLEEIKDIKETDDKKVLELENKLGELENRIGELQNQLLEKDKIILDYSKQIIDFTNRFAEMAEKSQIIAEKALDTTGQAQLLHAVDKQIEVNEPIKEVIEPVAVIEEPKKKSSWWHRFWYGDN